MRHTDDTMFRLIGKSLRRTTRSITNGLRGKFVNSVIASERHTSSETYWNHHNVTLHKRFSRPLESFEYLDWRNSQYVDYEKLLPASGHDGEVILDYGCGPGHDLIGFLTHSSPAKLYGADLSRLSISEAQDRLKLHGYECQMIPISESDERIPLEDETVDYIHCSGVLNHVPNPERILGEFRRILKPGAYARLMVYNHDSLWLHLYVSHILPASDARYRGLPLDEAFRRSTDGFDCPISRNWTVEEMIRLAQISGFEAKHLGNSVSLFELSLLPHRFAPMMNPSFRTDSRKFLLKLMFDHRGIPFVEGQVAGIDGCYELRK